MPTTKSKSNSTYMVFDFETSEDGFNTDCRIYQYDDTAFQITLGFNHPDDAIKFAKSLLKHMEKVKNNKKKA